MGHRGSSRSGWASTGEQHSRQPWGHFDSWTARVRSARAVQGALIGDPNAEAERCRGGRARAGHRSRTSAVAAQKGGWSRRRAQGAAVEQREHVRRQGRDRRVDACNVERLRRSLVGFLVQYRNDAPPRPVRAALTFFGASRSRPHLHRHCPPWSRCGRPSRHCACLHRAEQPTALFTSVCTRRPHGRPRRCHTPRFLARRPRRRRRTLRTPQRGSRARGGRLSWSSRRRTCARRLCRRRSPRPC